MTGVFDEDFAWPLWSGPVAETDDAGTALEDPTAIATELLIVDVHRPQLLGFRPPRPNGRAVMIMAGGGYTKLVIGKEGIEVARWLTSLGFHAFVLVHRLPSSRFNDGNRLGEQAPVDDAIEAMRLIRARAAGLGIDSRAVGALGLSSGGHLAACLAAMYPASWKAPESLHASISARPDFLIVGYGPISTNAAGRTVVADKPPLSPPEKQALYDAMQPDAQMIGAPPPTFIVYAADDPVIPVANAYRLADAVRTRGVAPELHVFASAPHGFALRASALPVGAWPQLCSAWLRQQGFLDQTA
ncbi:alpha/beta hydrolase [Uliginosibacterium sp. H1]|uniref:alpha/beta hydrolase n=1 Tax=Uliginosibacterium sp. H1 TaxID=3114757 RepID=UPI002E16EFC3|nr:alpha/beta hydrolase [Uliginosibacterium sp. H1]